MTAKDLKASILQLAIQGKLVPQDPNDEPAEVLLSKIVEEKKSLIREKRIKKEKPLPAIEESELPFDLPEGWVWVRWGELSESIQYGYNAPAQQSGRIKMVRISDVQDGKVLWNSVPYCDIPEESINDYLLCKNDILFARTGGTVGKSYIVSEVPEDAVYAGYLIRTRYSSSLSPQYFKYFMESDLYWKQLHEGTIATAQPNCNGKTLAKMIVPLPPLAEQKRIVSKLDELMPMVERYAAAKAESDELEANLPDAFRKSVLQQAVEGKLVPQDPNDEPAEVLLERIRGGQPAALTQRTQRAQRGAKNPVKKYPLVTDDEKPFDLPAAWTWCRLGEVSNYGQCEGTDSAAKGTWILDLEDIEKGGRILTVNRTRSSASTKHLFVKGQVLYSKLRPYLQKVLVAPEDGCCTSEIIPITFYGEINPHYAVLVLNSPYFLDYVMNCCCGVKMPRVTTKDALNALFPLPPLAEQKRIVAKVEELLGMGEKLRVQE